MGPLHGLTILDLTTVIAGPYATQLLGDLGADIIKVEPPEGDMVRQIGPARNAGMGGLFLNTNRSKRSIVLDLKTEQGRTALLRIAKRADAFVYNMRPQAMERLKLSYRDVSAVNKRMIYLGLHGFGLGGPYGGAPAYDDLLQGASGLASLAGTYGDGTPGYAPVAVADRMTGMYAATCLLAAIHHRTSTGRGQRIDVPMFEVMTSVVLGDHMGGLTFDPPLDSGGYARLLSKHRRPYRTQDGYVCAVIYTDRHWRRFWEITGRPDRIEDPRFRDHATRSENIDGIYSEVVDIFMTDTTDNWIKILRREDIPVMPTHDLDSILHDPHLVETEFFQTVIHPSEGRIRGMKAPSTWSETPLGPNGHAPRLGEHTQEILDEFVGAGPHRA